MSITTVGPHLIHYEVLGRGQPLIFIHGWLGSWRYWWPSMQALSSQHRSFAFDLWGFGDSSKSRDRYTLADYVEMVGQFINQLGIASPVILVGHSLGAAVALRYAVQNPDVVAKVAMVALPLHSTSIHGRLTYLEPDAFIDKVIGKSNSFSEVDSEIRKTDPVAMNDLAKELISSREINLGDDLTNCTRPILLVFGGQDSVVQLTPGVLSPLQRSNSNRHFVVLEECSHFPMLQEKAKFNRLLLDFIHADTLTEITPKEYWQRRTR